MRLRQENDEGKEEMSTFARVLAALLCDKSSRDCDRVLLQAVWAQEIREKRLNPERLMDYLLEGCLTNPDSITRARRKLQSEYTQLRGSRWAQRQKYALVYGRMIA